MLTAIFATVLSPFRRGVKAAEALLPRCAKKCEFARIFWKTQRRELSIQDNFGLDCDAEAYSATLAPVCVIPIEDADTVGIQSERDKAIPWRTVKFANGIPGGKWISLQYRTSFFDLLTRPMLRLRMPTCDHDWPMPAALFGRNTWVGYIPLNTTQILISPAQTGKCEFTIESCKTMSLVRLVVLGLSRNWSCTFLAIWLWLLGAKEKAHDQFRVAVNATPIKHYHEWRARSIRVLDVVRLDVPRTDWRTGPHIRFILDEPTTANSAVTTATIHSIRRQDYPHWSVAFVGPSINIPADHSSQALFESGRAIRVANDAPAACLWSDIAGPVIISPITLGGILPQYAGAVLAEYVATHLNEEFIYADEDSQDDSGRFCDPKLKPDWSSVFQSFYSYVGDAIYFRPSLFSRRHNLVAEDFLQPTRVLKSICDQSNDTVGHLRRIMLTKVASREMMQPHISSSDIENQSFNLRRLVDASATIIIPTKDKPQILADCLASVRLTQNQNFDVIVVDNGSIEPKTWRLYESLKEDSRIRIVSAPGRFNFSSLCNQGAALSHASVLIFLNNDTVCIQADWLSALCRWASRLDVGAVGAKLLYPSHRRIQHGGVVAGLGGYAGHIDGGARADHLGYLRRMTVPHEVSAVSGACLAIEKIKFDKVGGFDEENFPVELNDIDLCLRLSHLGWKTIFTPEATLIHHESATRGKTKFLGLTYAHEQRNFRLRWQSFLRDDPYFHAALSLQSNRTMLA